MYKASFKEENYILDAVWFECSSIVKVSIDSNGFLELSNITDIDRPIIQKALAEAGRGLIEVIEDDRDWMYDLLLKARNTLHKREDLDVDLIKVHDYLDIVLDSWK